MPKPKKVIAVEDSPLKRVRLRLRMSQTELAAPMGLNISTLSRIERGLLWPDRETMTVLLNYLETLGVRMTADEILFPELYIPPEKSTA